MRLPATRALCLLFVLAACSDDKSPTATEMPAQVSPPAEVTLRPEMSAARVALQDVMDRVAVSQPTELQEALRELASLIDSDQMAKTRASIRSAHALLNGLDERQSDPEIAVIRLSIETIEQVLKGTAKETAQ